MLTHTNAHLTSTGPGARHVRGRCACPDDSFNSVMPRGAAKNACATQSFDVAEAATKHCAWTDDTRWRATGSGRIVAKLAIEPCGTKWIRPDVTDATASNERSPSNGDSETKWSGGPKAARSKKYRRKAGDVIGDGISSSEKAERPWREGG